MENIYQGGIKVEMKGMILLYSCLSLYKNVEKNSILPTKENNKRHCITTLNLFEPNKGIKKKLIKEIRMTDRQPMDALCGLVLHYQFPHQ